MSSTLCTEFCFRHQIFDIEFSTEKAMRKLEINNVIFTYLAVNLTRKNRKLEVFEASDNFAISIQILERNVEIKSANFHYFL